MPRGSVLSRWWQDLMLTAMLSAGASTEHSPYAGAAAAGAGADAAGAVPAAAAGNAGGRLCALLASGLHHVEPGH